MLTEIKFLTVYAYVIYERPYALGSSLNLNFKLMGHNKIKILNLWNVIYEAP